MYPPAREWPPTWRGRPNTRGRYAAWDSEKWSLRRIGLEAFDERRGAARPARDDENRVVAGNRADRLVESGPIERLGEHLRLASARAHDDQLLHALDAAQEISGRALERRQRGLGIGRLRAGA